MANFVFTNTHVFDGSGAASTPGEARIEDDRITAVAGPGEQLPREGAELIDCGGMTLIPGLVEAHAHLSWPSSVEKIVPGLELPPEEQLLATARNARVLLDHGFTAAFSAGALGDRIEVALKKEIEAGFLPGPRLRASTIERSPPESPDHTLGSIQVSNGRGPEAMKAFVKHCAEIGVETVKLLISGEDALLPGSSQHILYDEAEVQAAGEQARESGVWLAAHTQASEAVKMALRGGVRVLYHCTYADAEALDMLEAQKDRIFMAPAIGIIIATLEAKPPPHFDMTQMKESAKPVVELASKLVPELKRRGVRVLPGGDYGFPFNPNGRNARDLQHFVDLFGYSPAEALSAGTKLGGEIMGLELGQIRPGYLADLLLVDGDPSTDVSILQDKRNLKAIMKGGAFYKRDASMLGALASAA
jgi:imidazolonepropionase-like amidohydrolase